MSESYLGGHRRHEQRTAPTMELPLFPLDVVLFPKMMLPLHIFEPRYREMINRCIDEKMPFGVVLARQGGNADGGAETYDVGTAARITRVERKPDGRMEIRAVGTRRFRIHELHREHAYLTGEVTHLPVVNGDTRLAGEQAQRVRPKLMRYVELLGEATTTQLELDQLPSDPTNLAYLTGMALQLKNEDKQRILAQTGVPEMLDMANYLLGRELQLLRHMLDSQHVVERLTSGPTGHLFDN